MKWAYPGTVLKVDRADVSRVREQFHAMFLPGGIVLSQVAGITGLEPYTVQNWVKRGFLPPPQNKRYDCRQLCRIISINMLKSVLPMERICSLISYINGRLDDTEDDVIDDAELYFLFVLLASRAEEGDLTEQTYEDALSDYSEPVPGAKERVREVLQIMISAWQAACAVRNTQEMTDKILKE